MMVMWMRHFLTFYLRCMSCLTWSCGLCTDRHGNMVLQSGGLPWSTNETGSRSFLILVVSCPQWMQGVTGCWSRKVLYAGHNQTAWRHRDVPILDRWCWFSYRDRWLFLLFACCGNGPSRGDGFLSAATAVSAHSSAFGCRGCRDVFLLCSSLPTFASYLSVHSSSHNLKL